MDDDETPEQRLRRGHMAIINRGETSETMNNHALPSLVLAMVVESARALAEAFPDDRFYQEQYAEWKAKRPTRVY